MEPPKRFDVSNIPSHLVATVNHNATLPLLRLPQELRDEIFGYVMAEPDSLPTLGTDIFAGTRIGTPKQYGASHGCAANFT